MRIAIALAITLAASPLAAASSDPAAPPHHHRHHHHAASPEPEAVAPRPGVEAVAPAPTVPVIKPYAPGEGDEDGLSRDPDDCAKGCIGGNPG
ncbi:MAG: hypothetical protein P4L80_01145 [Xanthobacteraceae bacterium]|nr:hypothetical protein [Xanthobacteraceae bacterium]